MPFEYSIAPEERIAVVTVRPPDDFLSSDDAVRSLVRDPRLEPGMGILVDLRATDYSPTFEHARRLAALHGDAEMLQGHRTALVIKPGTSVLGGSRLMGTLAEFLGAEARVFTDLAEATSWLRG